MKLSVARSTVIVLFIFAASLVVAPVAKADPVSGDYITYTPLSGALTSCNGNGFSLNITVSGKISYAGHFDITSTLNGVPIPGRSGVQIPVLPPINQAGSLVQSAFTSAFPTGQTSTYTLVSHFTDGYTAGPNAGQLFYDQIWTFTCNPLTGIGTYTINENGSTASAAACAFPDISDGRLNSLCADAAQTATFYCTKVNDTQALSIFSVWSSKGTESFKVTQAELDKFPSKPATNTLIKAGKYASLYRLTSGELQVNTYTSDAYVFTGTPATIAQICSGTGK